MKPLWGLAPEFRDPSGLPTAQALYLLRGVAPALADQYAPLHELFSYERPDLCKRPPRGGITRLTSDAAELCATGQLAVRDLVISYLRDEIGRVFDKTAWVLDTPLHADLLARWQSLVKEHFAVARDAPHAPALDAYRMVEQLGGAARRLRYSLEKYALEAVPGPALVDAIACLRVELKESVVRSFWCQVTRAGISAETQVEALRRVFSSLLESLEGEHLRKAARAAGGAP